MKKFMFGFILLGVSYMLHSQEILIDKDVDEQYKATHGPNMRHYGHFYIGAGMVADFDEEIGTSIEWWRSGQFLLGYRYKLKLLSFYAIGLDVNFKYTQYFFEDADNNPYDEGNPLTYELDRNRHYLSNNGLGLEFYHRINIGKRGNSLGNYLDTGIRGQWNLADVEDILIKTGDDNVPVRRTRIINRRLNYIEPFSWGVTARIGVGKVIAYANYRLSDYFRKSINGAVPLTIPEVPRLTTGVQFVL